MVEIEQDILTALCLGCVISIVLSLWILERYRKKNMHLESLVESYKWKDKESAREINDLKQRVNLLSLESKEWELKATAPKMGDRSPVIIHKANIQKVAIRTEIKDFPVMREKAIREGVDKIGDFIAPMVYSEFTDDDFGRKVLHQEIWIGLSEKFQK